ncbi:dimeric dihydrodiol dehydrogenase [Penicillium macrosclerotiorum]|uniref:dimeric dihydrodiol dehydrogenase n=1 Tax=Penicillium macrosclerotiorum TaxID=303699 RepID=UPI0025496B65|nr:dimeric dihydrodiol dehydrogenase [Penicillium macrosclerotiorum]KAJ5669726.1 dimeric dihydrodiol dehydrogenase [Penicillium macrosclerotiorum]
MASEFARDILASPGERRVNDIVHVLTGVGSSTSLATAKAFLDKVNAPSTCLAYGTYNDLAKNPDIDIVYIATPHSHHFQNAMLALHSGKHVLCEKPLTVNADQAKCLFALAEKKNRFIMEGMWTRFQPIGTEIRRLLDVQAVGKITRIVADNSIGMNPLRDFDPQDRMVNKNLAGGALLDLGVYSIQWVTQHLPKELRRPEEVHSVVSKHASTGVDESTAIILKFPASGCGESGVIGIVSASLRTTDSYDGQSPVIRIQGDKGEIQIFGPSWRPSHLHVIEREQGFEMIGNRVHEFKNHIPKERYGLGYQADEVGICIRDGKLQCPLMSSDDTILSMEIMDRVRQSHGLEFPEEIESTTYPLALSIATRSP